jgi:molybdopterin converting factor small subunit
MAFMQALNIVLNSQVFADDDVIYRATELPEFILMDATQIDDLNEHLEQIKPETEAEQNKKHLMKVINTQTSLLLDQESKSLASPQ